jgi:hypothetical protein
VKESFVAQSFKPTNMHNKSLKVTEEPKLGLLADTIAQLDVSSSALKVNNLSRDVSLLDTSITEENVVEKDTHSSFTSKLLHLALKLPNFRSEVEQKPYNEMTWSEMWSLLLLANISEENYYLNPEKMLEIQHGTPFTIKKELIDAIIHSDGKTWSYKVGTNILL